MAGKNCKIESQQSADVTDLDINPMDVLAAINARAVRAIKDDPGWKTRSEWATEWNLSDTTTGYKLKYAVSQGLMDQKNVMRQDVNGVLKPKPAYKFLGKKK